jgi:lysophospholipase L1-like esterase
MSSPYNSPRKTYASNINNENNTTPKKSPKRKSRSGGVASAVTNDSVSRNNEILFYGDSLTFGMSHTTADRYETTWPQLIFPRLNAINSKLKIIESALCSRTTRFDDLKYDNKTWLPQMTPDIFNGKKCLVPTLLSHSPKWLVLLIGTNDLKTSIQNVYNEEAHNDLGVSYRSNLFCAKQIAKSVCELAKMAKTFNPDIQVIILTPPPIRVTDDNLKWGFTTKSEQISYEFPKAFKAVCKKYGFYNVCCDKDSIDMEESDDGIHLTKSHNVIYADKFWEHFQMLEDSMPKRKRRPKRRH